jgi:hypothetical protein
MLNPLALVEHNNDSIVNGTILRCSLLRSSNQHFDKKNNTVDYPRKDLGIMQLVKWLIEIMSFMPLICMLPHVAICVCYDQRLVLRSFWTLGECAQAPFSCIPTPCGFCFSYTLNSVMSSSCPN